MERSFKLIGVGLYAIPEVRRLTRVPGPTVNRWVKGYARRRRGHRVEYPALINPSLPTIQDQIALSFRDLIEIRFIGQLRQHGVSWQEIRNTIDKARDLLDTDHPFGTRRFATDGKNLFSEIAIPGILLKVRDNQLSFERVFSPELLSEIEYEQDEPARWWPWSQEWIVLDPNRSFGKPIVEQHGIPTDIVAKAVAAESSIDRVAEWYEIPVDAVRAAVEFEEQLQAA